MGGEAIVRSGTEGRAARGGPQHFTERIYRAHAGLQARISQPVARNRAHAPRAETMLRLHGIQLRLVRGRLAESLQHAQGEAVYLAAAAHRGRAHAGVGPAELPAERSGLQSREPRWLWRRLAVLLQRSGAVLRH